jgi:carboxyl-terminal processing protease
MPSTRLGPRASWCYLAIFVSLCASRPLLPSNNLYRISCSALIVEYLFRRLYPYLFPLVVSKVSSKLDQHLHTQRLTTTTSITTITTSNNATATTSLENNIQVGDYLVSLDGEDVTRKDSVKLRKMFCEGFPGEMVQTVFYRKEESNLSTAQTPAIFNWILKKDYMVQHDVKYSLISNGEHPPIGYVRISNFCDETFNEFRRVLLTLERALLQEQQDHSPAAIRKFNREGNLGALVIDLRDNLGGTVVSALDVAALFLPYGCPLVQFTSEGQATKSSKQSLWRSMRKMLFREKNREVFYSRNRRANRKTALLLLANERTASASEQLIEALSDNNRAISMGKRTVGKTKAQVCYYLLSYFFVFSSYFLYFL